MRAIGLVLLSIAIMALLLTDADAKRRSSAQGSQAAGAAEAGARPIPVRASATTAAIPRSTSAIKRSWASAAFADPIRFRARLTGPGTAGQVRCARAAMAHYGTLCLRSSGCGFGHGQQIEVLYARSGREIDMAFASLSQKPIDAILSGLP